MPLKGKAPALEHREQRALMAWAGWHEYGRPELRLLFAIPNGGHRHPAVAGKLKAEGVKAGVPDLCLPVPKNGYHGLFIEMKAPDGRATPSQKAWQRLLTAYGYRAEVCHGFEAARKVIEDYLGYHPVSG
ncbi:MAG: VRR-NUC domain-containing protein [Desulforudis sp.]|nr:MAG: VRR-NUC domain-containing protein [Desulforudis sp.]